MLLPLHLAVDNWKEPDVDEGQKPILLYATVTVESLSANKKYTIVRYDDIANIPTDSSFLSGKYDYKHEFTYNGTWRLVTTASTFGKIQMESSATRLPTTSAWKVSKFCKDSSDITCN